MDVLLAHIKAVLRRANQKSAAIKSSTEIVVGGVRIDPLTHTVSVNGRPVELTPREFDLLHTFALEPNRVFSVDDLLARVWGAEFNGQPQVVYVQIRMLRENLEIDPNHPQWIITVRGVGYKLEIQAQDDSHPA
jgi:DNA-binding response OmpR family regulator